MKPRYFGLMLGLLYVAVPSNPARAQGLIVDRRPGVPVARAFEIREVSVNARVREQVAEVQVSQVFHNPGSTVVESEYLFPLPDEGAIQNFVLLVDGKEMPGRILPKDEARRIYEEVVRTKRDPALLEFMGRDLFRTSVFPIPPGADRTVTLRYTQLCRRERDVVTFLYPFATQKFTAKPIQHLSLNLQIHSSLPIKSIFCPSHDATIQKDNEHEATVKLQMRDVVPVTDFRMVYTLADGAVGATLLSYRPSDSEDGYFLLLASPQVKASDAKPQPKTVIFVLDRSGSMAGKKIEQAKKSLQFVLDNLREDDLFNIVVYDDRVESYKPELQRYTKESRADASRFVENIQAGGSTNIDSALKSALAMLHDDARPSYVLFMTDGLPTAGEQRETAIADNCRGSNKNHARIFVFGVGFDVNARLLDRISGTNAGTSEYVRPDEDIESHVARFYAKLTSPALTGIQIELAHTDINRTYPRDIPDLFEGGQLVWVGRYRQPGQSVVRLTGKVGGERRTFEFPTQLAGSDRGPSYDFVERIWVTRRIGFIIDQIDLNGKNKELIDELVALSTKHGILTPYTSFLADERVQLHRLSDNSRRAGDELTQLSEVSGGTGVAQRAMKGGLLSADKNKESEEVRLRVAAKAAPAQAGAGFGSSKAAESFRFQGGRLGALYKNTEGKDAIAMTVRNVGTKTFFLKGNRWVDAELKEEDEAKAEKIEQFSDRYFELARSQSASQNQYLTFEEATIVSIDGKVYQIEIGSRE
jgi:Ca-activated chloride channel family protein